MRALAVTAIAFALLGCRDDRPKRTAPVIARPLPEAGAARNVDAATLALAKTARDAAVKLAGDCQIYSSYEEDDSTRYHDSCAWGKDEREAMRAASKALVAVAPDAGDARVFIEHVRLFTEWMELAEGGNFNGALAHYQALALAWNSFQPQDPIGIDVYKRSSYDNPPDAGPLAWRRCASGSCVVFRRK